MLGVIKSSTDFAAIVPRLAGGQCTPCEPPNNKTRPAGGIFIHPLFGWLVLGVSKFEDDAAAFLEMLQCCPSHSCAGNLISPQLMDSA